MIYVIGPKRGPVKIGFSGAAGVRINALQTGHPHRLYILAECHGELEDEAAAHTTLSIWRVRPEGEWFYRSKEVQKFIDFLSGGLPVPLAIKKWGEYWRAEIDLKLSEYLRSHGLSDGQPMPPVLAQALAEARR